jgi:hypothetical protein
LKKNQRIPGKESKEFATKKVANKDLNALAQLGLPTSSNVPLLQALHILTRDGMINQDSRRKLKQVNHLLQFIEPLLAKTAAAQGQNPNVSLVDHGAGKSYLGFMLYDRFFAAQPEKGSVIKGSVIGVEVRQELVERSRELAAQFGFDGMRFVNSTVAQSSDELPTHIDIVTALHACDTATDDAIAFGLKHKAQHIVLVPCCQAEVATQLRSTKSHAVHSNPLVELWRRPLHTREFGAQLTNVLRCLQLESHGYEVTVTELVGWEHSMKNELIIASRGTPHARSAGQRLQAMLDQLGLDALRPRFFSPLLEVQTGISA